MPTKTNFIKANILLKMKTKKEKEKNLGPFLPEYEKRKTKKCMCALRKKVVGAGMS